METSTSTSSANLGPYIPAALRLREQVGPLLGAGTCNAKPTRPGRRGRDATGARPLWWPLQWPGPLNTLRPATRSARKRVSCAKQIQASPVHHHHHHHNRHPESPS